MAKELNVNLAFTADTAQAKAKVNDLANQIDQVINKSAMSSTKMPLTKELMEAQTAAASLKGALVSAVNTDTGKLDLTKFSTSLKKSGLSLTTLEQQLSKLGPEGSAAFLSLTDSILTAEVPLRRAGTLIDQFYTTLKNTARWQISSSMLHGFVGTFQQAYGYAESLNASLNNIRIVTSYSTDEMASFAKEANKAAQALSTTTTEYTDASLIYYQQGLSDSEVKERTDATIKLANVTGDSAEIVSNQMTSIWNNFADGSQSLEYYADVITALGAATASSTDEIAEGLEKFASTAQTVGLSYEYATSALATVTAATRQSADVVGTAFKTLFARIQDLEQGATLDDGVTLGTYSEALSKINVAVLDANGNMRRMDDILTDMASQWSGLSEAQKVATAETLAGVRQYTQLMSLMEHWTEMEDNLTVAYNSEGTLQEQADIYAESWEAARDRVKAAAESIYSSLINDEFFIDLADGTAKALNLVEKLIESMGGLKGVLGGVGLLVTKIFNKQLSQGVDNLIYGINSLRGANLKTADDQKQEAYNASMKIARNSASAQGNAEIQALQSKVKLQQQLQDLVKQNNLTETDQQRLQTLLDINNAYAEQAILAGKALDAASQDQGERNAQTKKAAARKGITDNQYDAGQSAMKKTIDQAYSAQSTLASINGAMKDEAPEQYAQKLDYINNTLKKLGQQGAIERIKGLTDALEDGRLDAETFDAALQDIIKDQQILQDGSISAANAMLDEMDMDYTIDPNFTQQVDDLADGYMNIKIREDEVTQSSQNLEAQEEQTKQAMINYAGAAKSLGTSMIDLTSRLSGLVMGISSLKTAWDTINDPDASAWDKFSTVIMSVSMALPGLINGLGLLSPATLKSYAESLLLASGYTIEAGTITTATGATIGFGAALWTVLSPILLVVAGIAALVFVGKKIYDILNEDAIAAENLATAAEDSTSALNDIKTATDNINSSFSNLDSAIDELHDLTYGSAEWAEKLAEVNSETTDLITNYNKLASAKDQLKEGDDYYRDAEGALHLTDSGKEKIQNQQKERLASATTANNATTYASDMAQTQADAATIGNKYLIDPDSLMTVANAITNGTLSFEDLGNKQALIAAGLNEKAAEWIANDEELQGEISDLTAATMANTEAYTMKTASELAGDSELMKDINKNVDEEYQTGVVNKMASDTVDREKTIMADKDFKITADDKSDYAKSLGYTEGKNGKYTNANGDSVELSEDAVKQWKAHTKAVKESKAAVDGYKKSAKESAKVWEAADDAKKYWSGITKAIKKAKDEGKKFANVVDKEVFKTVKKDLAKMLNLSEDMSTDFLSPEFVEENADLIEDALNGDVEALEEFQNKAQEEFLVSIGVDDSTLTEEARQAINDCDASLDDLEVGATLNDDAMRSQLANLVTQTNMSAKEMQEYLALHGFKGIKIKPGYENLKGADLAKFIQGDVGTISGNFLTSMKVETIGSGSGSGGGNSGGSGGGKSSGGGGGKSSKPEKKKIKDEIDRYHEVTLAIEDVNDALDSLAKKKNNAYGQEYLDLLDEEIEKNKELLKLYNERYLEEAQANYDSDKKKIEANAKHYGFKLEYDSEGNISNYNEYKKAMVKYFNQKKHRTKKEENYFETATENLDNYEDSNKRLKEIKKEAEDIQNQIMAANYEKITKTLEFKIKVNDNEIKFLERTFNKLSDNIYKAAEAFDILQDQIDTTASSLGAYDETFKALNDSFNSDDENLKISKEDYVEGLQECYDSVLDQLDALEQLDQQMKEYYGNTLKLATEELSLYTDQLDHLASVAEHYQNIHQLTSLDKDFTFSNKLYKTQASLAENSYKSALAWESALKEQGKEIEANWNSVKDNPDAANYDIYKQMWVDWKESMEAAEEDSLAKAEEYAQALQNILTLAMEEAAYNMDKALAGSFGSVDELNQMMSIKSSYADEYLTKTNQIYEMNKMLNNINQASLKTDSQIAKQKYAAFSEEIKQLQEKDQLSNLELSIAQAKYEVLQKQIALEEAQNAKNTVRLSRDSEGNYGYVYTANQNAISGAEQELADAENKLYNVQLQGANNYGQKRLQAQQEYANALKEVNEKRLAGEYANEEEYNKAIANLDKYYKELILAYDEQYMIAQQDDARVVEDAWVNSFGEITQAGYDFSKAIDDYCDTTKEALSQWKESTHDIKEVTYDDLDDLTKKGNELKDTIVDDLVPALNTELSEALDNVTEYINEQRDAVKELIAYYDQLIKDIKEAIAEQSKVNTPASDDGKDDEDKDGENENKDGENENKEEVKNGVTIGHITHLDSSSKSIRATAGSDKKIVTLTKALRKADYTIKDSTKIGKVVWVQISGANYTGWVKKSHLTNFDTGGYTGKWGTDGKLAMLHEKELVLNKDDTTNLLQSVNILRELTQSIDTQALLSSLRLGNMVAAMPSIGSDVLEQHVTITAEFPNATDHNEIEEAFNNLINQASQYANRY